MIATGRPAGLALVALVAAFVLSAAAPASGGQDPDDPDLAQARAEWAMENELAQRYVPRMMLVAQDEECGAGEPYFPTDVDLLLDNPEIALRGPWTERDLVEAGPSAESIGRGLRGFELDFPGDALNPGCDYERWTRRLFGTRADAVVYAHVARQADAADRLALMYFFFYPYNDYNNKHEGDWERIQLEFPVGTAAEALETEPDRAVYSQHYGSEEARWDGDKLELADGRPVVYVSAGSHASQFAPGIYMGNSAATGFGCDVTTGPHDEVDPAVRTIPSDAELASEMFPWIDYEGLWGERSPVSFYSGPTGPARKSAWTRPLAWSDGARSTSIALPGGAAAGTEVSDFYCSAVAGGSDVFRSYVQHPARALVVLGVVAWLVTWLARRGTWRSASHPVRRRRNAAQVVHASWRAGRENPRAFALLSVTPLALSVLGTALNAATLTTRLPWWLTALVSPLIALGLLVALGAAALWAAGRDAGDDVRLGEAYLRSARACTTALPALVVAATLTVLSAGSLVLLPLALVLLGIWSTLVPVVVLERRRGLGALARSARLARGAWRTVVPVVLGALLVASSVGALLAALMFAAVPLPFVVMNLVPPLTLGLVWPFLSVAIAYCYFSAAAADAEPALSPSAG